VQRAAIATGLRAEAAGGRGAAMVAAAGAVEVCLYVIVIAGDCGG
jgi:hypothetical protein